MNLAEQLAIQAMYSEQAKADEPEAEAPTPVKRRGRKPKAQL
jgi:hypothetical protein